MPDDVTIRPVSPDDAAAVCAILDAVIVNGSQSLLDTPFSLDDERRYIEAFPGAGVFLVAEAGDEGVVAFQSLEPYGSFGTHAFDHVLTIGTYVREDRRRRGIGRTLAEASFAGARRRGGERIVTEVRMDNDGALGFYFSLGFAVAGVLRELARIGGRSIDVALLERRL